MVTILMSAKMVRPGILKRKVCWNKDYEIMISVHDVTNEMLSHDSHYSVGVDMVSCGQSLVALAFI